MFFEHIALIYRYPWAIRYLFWFGQVKRRNHRSKKHGDVNITLQ